MNDRDAMALFDELIELAPAERQRALAEAPPSVARFVAAMLTADRSFLRTGQGLALASSLADEPLPPPPEHIEGFAILGLLGEGGMGRVFDAEQESPKRRVALKMLHPWLAAEPMRDWLRNEAQALAALLHPGIPQIYTLVEDGDHVFLAMERVDGLPLGEAVQNRSLSQRLALFLQIVAAMTHAHGRGYLHLDLKPDNVLVTTEGQAKVLDFGLARLKDSGEGPRAGTVGFMPPEQARGDALDVRADVYALGGILATLIDRQSELQAIVSRATQVDPADRYGSADALGAEIRRYQSHQPVIAFEGGLAYRFRKSVRRHPVVFGAAAAILTVSTLATGYSLDKAQRAEEARVRAEELKVLAQTYGTQAADTSAFLTEVFLKLDPGRNMGEVTLLDATLSAVEKLDAGALKGAAHQEAQIRMAVAEAFFHLRRIDDAKAQLEATLALYDRPDVSENKTLIDALHGSAAVARFDDRLEDAKSLLERASELADRLNSPSRAADLRHELGVTLRTEGDLPAARASLAKAMDQKRALHAEKPLPAHLYTNTMHQLGYVYLLLGDYAAAEPLFVEALKIEEEELSSPHPRIASSLHWLADSYHQQGRQDLALQYLTRAGEMRDALGMARTAASRPAELNLLGSIHLEEGRFPEAEAAIHAYAEVEYDGDLNRLHRNQAWTYAAALAGQGRAEEALEAVANGQARDASAAEGSAGWAWRTLLNGSVRARLGDPSGRADLEAAIAYWEGKLSAENHRVRQLRADLERLAR